MDHRDEEWSDVVVVLKDLPGLAFQAAVTNLTSLGLSVSELVEDEGVIEGSIQACKIKELQKQPFVEAVRTVFTYMADFTCDNPRNQDQDDAPDPESADDAGA